MLPWDSTRRTFIILLQVNPLLPGLLVLCIASNNLSHVLHVTGLSPGPWDNCVVFLFLVQDNILQPWVAHALQVVKTQSCHDNDYYGLWILLHGCQEALESFGQDAKGILDYLSGSGNTIVEDPLIYVQDSLGERLHEPWLQWKGIIADDEIRHDLISRRRFWLRYSQSVMFQSLPEG